MMDQSANLYIVATPIGNLKDITLRALELLRQVPVVACEDTRRTGQLAAHYSIKAKLIAVHGDNEQQRIPHIIALLQEGTDVAYVSDAGTPAISDPGAYLVAAAHKHAIKVVPIPGVSSVSAALSCAGLAHHRYTFHGFLPKKSGALTRLIQSWFDYDTTHVCFLSGREVVSVLSMLAQHLPAETMIVLAKELTKIYETIVRLPLTEMLVRCQNMTHKGEYVLIVDKVQHQLASQHNEEDIAKLLQALVHSEPVKSLVPVLTRVLKLPKNQLYSQLSAIKNQSSV